METDSLNTNVNNIFKWFSDDSLNLCRGIREVADDDTDVILNLAPNLQVLAGSGSNLPVLAEFLDERVILRSRNCKLVLATDGEVRSISEMVDDAALIADRYPVCLFLLHWVIIYVYPRLTKL